MLLGCKQEAVSSSSHPVPEVGVVTLETQTMPDEPEFIGQAESSRIVEIRSQVTGIITERYFEEGREIKEGDRLYRVDPEQANQDLDRVKPLLGVLPLVIATCSP